MLLLFSKNINQVFNTVFITLGENSKLVINAPDQFDDQHFGDSSIVETYVPSPKYNNPMAETYFTSAKYNDIAEERSASFDFSKWTPIIGVKPTIPNRHNLANDRHVDPRNPVFVFIDKLLGKKQRPVKSKKKLPAPKYKPTKPSYAPPKPSYDAPKPSYGPPKQKGDLFFCSNKVCVFSFHR